MSFIIPNCYQCGISFLMDVYFYQINHAIFSDLINILRMEKIIGGMISTRKRSEHVCVCVCVCVKIIPQTVLFRRRYDSSVWLYRFSTAPNPTTWSAVKSLIPSAMPPLENLVVNYRTCISNACITIYRFILY